MDIMGLRAKRQWGRLSALPIHQTVITPLTGGRELAHQGERLSDCAPPFLPSHQTAYGSRERGSRTIPPICILASAGDTGEATLPRRRFLTLECDRSGREADPRLQVWHNGI